MTMYAPAPITALEGLVGQMIVLVLMSIARG